MPVADKIPFGPRSPRKQEPVSPPRGTSRESSKGPKVEGRETPPRPLSSTPHTSEEKHTSSIGINAQSHKVMVYMVWNLLYSLVVIIRLCVNFKK